MINFLGGLGAAYKGYQAGADAELERQQREVRNATERRRLSDEETLAPMVLQQKQLQTQAAIDQARADAEVAPIKRDVEKRAAQLDSDTFDGKAKLARGQIDSALQKQTTDAILQAEAGVQGLDKAQSSVMAIVGKQLAAGNYNGITQILENVIDSPMIPAWKSLGKPVKTELANPPEGVQDMPGQPAQPNALKITFDNGQVQWMNTGPLADAYRRQLAQQYKPQITKPGDVARDPVTGKELWKNDPLPPKGWIRNDQGDLEFIGGAGLGGSNAGKAGKAVDPMKSANDAWKTVATDSDAKLPPEVNARGARLTQQLVTDNPRMPATVAAEVALAVAQNPGKAEPSIDPRTGRIHTVYTDKQLGQVVIDRDVASASNPGDLTPEQMKTAVTKFVGAQPEGVRGKLVAAAFSADARKALEADMFKEFDADIEKKVAADPKQADSIRANADATRQATLKSLDEKLAMINKYGTPPKAKSDNGFVRHAGGILPNRDMPKTDPNSPAGRSQARQQQLRDESAARDQAKSERSAQLAEQFRRDRESMPAIELARKYDELRGQLPHKEAAELQQIERTL